MAAPIGLTVPVGAPASEAAGAGKRAAQAGLAGGGTGRSRATGDADPQNGAGSDAVTPDHEARLPGAIAPSDAVALAAGLLAAPAPAVAVASHAAAAADDDAPDEATGGTTDAAGAAKAGARAVRGAGPGALRETGRAAITPPEPDREQPAGPPGAALVAAQALPGGEAVPDVGVRLAQAAAQGAPAPNPSAVAAGTAAPAGANGVAHAPHDAPAAATPADQVGQALVGFSAGQGTHRVTVQLAPLELGRLQISLARGGAGPDIVTITAERAETLALVAADAAALHAALDKAGLPAAGRNLHFLLGEGPAQPSLLPAHAAPAPPPVAGGPPGGGDLSHGGHHEGGQRAPGREAGPWAAAPAGSFLAVGDPDVAASRRPRGAVDITA